MPEVMRLISSAINEALASDNANKRYLSDLGEVVIGIYAESPQVAIRAKIQDAKLSLSKLQDLNEQDCDLRISGTAINLAKLLLQPADNAAQLKESGVRIEGDVALLLELSQLAKKIDIDWEALLADKIGETPAVIMGQGLKGAKDLSEQFLASQQQALATWLKKADSPVPSREEYEQLKANLRQVHYQLDRLEAMLKQKQHKAEN